MLCPDPLSERPDTPVLAPTSTPETGRSDAAILIQRLLSGRAAQNSMYEGKMRRQALIEELKLGDSGAGERANRVCVKQIHTYDICKCTCSGINR